MLANWPQRAEAQEIPVNAPLRWHMGGGNLATHLAGRPSTQIYEALHGIGAKLGRMNSYGWRDLDHKPTPHDFDAAMLQAYQHGITPVILFEYEGAYQQLSPPQMIGTYDDWFKTGHAFASRFQPNGEWAKEHNIVNWGATIFTAINEPDVQATIPLIDYHNALKGLADGIRNVNPAYKIVPGGFATCNSEGDASLHGYGPAIADLLEDGHLDGIDLHTYYNARWFPLTKGKFFSAQSCFDRVKAAMGLHRDIHFYATEYNIARTEDWAEPERAASLFLTALWDEAGIVGNDRHTPVSMLAFPWNIGDTVQDENPPYAMATSKAPWRPDLRAIVLQNVLKLAGDMRFTQLDPDKKGTYTLEGAHGRLHVWQNRPDWTDHPADIWTIDTPEWAAEAQLWGWNGLLTKTKPKNGQVRFTGLSPNQTYMLLLPRP